MAAPRTELPPTAGLPLRWRDFAPGAPAVALGPALARMLEVDPATVAVTCSGTAALVLALSALQRTSARRSVIVPAYTCPLVAIAVAHCGLRLRLCDTRPGHFEMDPDALAALCDDDTLAIVPAHLGGRLADLGAPLRAARAAGAWVIEDAAQALGARHADGMPAGAAGDLAICSLAAGKGLSIFEGGALVAHDPGVRALIAELAPQVLPRSLAWEARRCVELAGYALFYGPRGLRWVYGRPLRQALRRGDDVAAAQDRFPLRIPLHRVGGWRQRIGARAAPRLPAFLDAARQRALVRSAQMRGIEGVQVLGDRRGERGTWPNLTLLFADPRARDAALRRLWGAGLGVSWPFVRALPDYAYLRGTVPRVPAPNARDFAARVLAIGNSPWLDDAAFARIARALEESCRQPHA
ncbi:DegT/DnrJ/EryC1/StrS family aminotransferase [Lysobacter enzymogenes]|uniref:Nucleotide sugar aminotransferase n=1 Tax=Lysobacter enzymogenes TaxID=69 RepID=A0A3N2RMU3_LYSEN|nr:DegT/DnrJ/EryC1/StrS family aminotransferase [Lysobacter enzymogenes]ROU08785.1 nucleotide sugar aminotransferase [Lysobacter enzymogenes]